MQLVFTDITPIRARRTDPATSQRSAKRAARFAESHKGRILHALRLHGDLTSHGIAMLTGLEVVQVDRRCAELKRDGQVIVVSDDGRYQLLRAV